MVDTIIDEKTTCSKHLILFNKCKSCDILLCKECVFDDKDQLKHLKDHYDFIQDLYEDSVEKSTENLHDFEGFEELNKIYKEKLNEVDNLIDITYERIFGSRQEIIKSVKETLFGIYQYYTNTFEDYVKKVNANIKTLDIQDQSSKEEFKKLKKKLDDFQEFLDSEEKIKAEFDKIITKATKKFEKLKVPDMAKENFKFNLGKFGENYDLKGGEGSFARTSTGKTGTYWVLTSEETFEGDFSAKIKVHKINNNRKTSYWNYTFGVIRANSTLGDTYYNDAVVIQANGYLANKFTSSGSFKKVLDPWIAGDEIIVKRSNDTIWFGINNEESLIKAFDSISGEMKIVIGFSTGNSGDEIELIDINKA